MEEGPSLGENVKDVFTRLNFDGNGGLGSDKRAAIANLLRGREKNSPEKLQRQAKQCR